MSNLQRPFLYLALACCLAGCAKDKNEKNKTKNDSPNVASSLKDKIFGDKKDDAQLAKAHNALGMVSTSKGDFATAAREFAKAVELDDKPEYYNNLGRCYFWLARYQDSLKSFAIAEKMGLKTPDLYANVADSYRLSGNLSKAIAMYHKSLAIDTKFLRAHYELGHLYLTKGDYKSAEERLNKALEIDPAFNKALLDRLIVYRMSGLYDKAYDDMLALDRRGYDIQDDLREQILDGVQKQRQANAG